MKNITHLDVVQLMQEVAHAMRFGLQICPAVRVRRRQHGDAAENLNAHRLHALELKGVVGHQLHALRFFMR